MVIITVTITLIIVPKERKKHRQSTNGMTTKIVFISGPLAPPSGYFETHYVPHLLAAIGASHKFVVGPAPGIDTMALDFLISQGVPTASITVYVAEFQDAERCAAELLGCKVRVEGATTGERDAAMTRDSDYDILRYMTPLEARDFYGDAYWPRISNTEKNERRRKELPLHSNPADRASGWGERMTRQIMGKFFFDV